MRDEPSKRAPIFWASISMPAARAILRPPRRARSCAACQRTYLVGGRFCERNRGEDARNRATPWASIICSCMADESPATVARLGRSFPVIKAVRVRKSFRSSQLARFKHARALLLDGFDANQWGGTGKTFDWRVAQRVQQRQRDFSGWRYNAGKCGAKRSAPPSPTRSTFAAAWKQSRGKRTRSA